MLTREEEKLLSRLREQIVVAVADLAGAVWPAAPPGWLDRAIWNLEGLGHVTVSYGLSGEPRIVQITDRGLGQAGGWLPSHADLAVCCPPGEVPVQTAAAAPLALPSAPAIAPLAKPVPAA